MTRLNCFHHSGNTVADSGAGQHPVSLKSQFSRSLSANQPCFLELHFPNYKPITVRFRRYIKVDAHTCCLRDTCRRAGANTDTLKHSFMTMICARVCFCRVAKIQVQTVWQNKTLEVTTQLKETREFTERNEFHLSFYLFYPGFIQWPLKQGVYYFASHLISDNIWVKTTKIKQTLLQPLKPAQFEFCVISSHFYVSLN